MAKGAALTFNDPDGYAAEFRDIRISLTITGSGDFKARLIRLKLQHLEVYCCCESVRRIAYISLPPKQVFISFPVGMAADPISDGFVLRNGDLVFHSRGERAFHRTNGACQWGLISLPPEQLTVCGEALTGRPIAPPRAGAILRPSRANVLRFQRLFAQACRLAEARNKLIESPEVARALEQEMLHAIVNCLAVDETDNNAKTRHHHAVVMGRFEECLSKRIDQKLTMPALCAEIGVPEKPAHVLCQVPRRKSERYILLQRLNKARSELRHADPSMATVAEVARNHQFSELGRFVVIYRTAFGESPSVTLQRDPQI